MPILDSLRFIEVIRDDANILTATPEQVLDTVMFIGTAKKIEQGKIPVLPIYTKVLLNSGDTYTVAYGHNPQEYTVTCAPLEEQTSGTMIAADLLKGKTGWVNGVLITGEMENNGAFNEELACSESVTIPKGYHDGNGHVVATSLALQTVATATDAEILIGKTAWVKGVLVVGTMIDNRATEITLQAGEEYIIPEGYHHGSGKVVVSTLASQTTGTAEAGDIAVGKTAWVNGVLITGTIPKIGAQTTKIPVNGTYTIPYGIHGGLGKVVNETPTIDGLTITPSFEAQTISVKGNYFTKDITVSALNALNYNLFDSTSQVLITDNHSVDSGTNFTIDNTLPVDNWHDNATFNLYLITATVSGYGSSDINTTGLIFANGLKSDKLDTSKFTILNDGTIDINVTHSFHADTNAHVFKLTVNNAHGTSAITVDIQIQEAAQFRQYGDNHDIYSDTTLATGSYINDIIDKSLVTMQRSSVEPVGITTTDISNKQDKSVVTWFDSTTNIQYWYSKYNKVYMNPDSSNMFYNCSELISVTGLGFDTSKVTNMSQMFMMGGLTKGKLADISELEKWDTSKVTLMYNLFSKQNILVDFDPLLNWDTSKVTDMGGMFDECMSMDGTFTSRLVNWKTTNVTNMESMFQVCRLITDTPSTFDTSNVKNMQFMFNGCSNLKNVTLYNTINVTNMQFMFSECVKLSNVPQFDTSKVTIMSCMFMSTKFTGTWEIQYDGDVNISNIFSSTTEPITMKYKTGNTSAAAYDAPVNVTKEIIN